MNARDSNIYMLALILYQLILTFTVTIIFLFFDFNVPMPYYIMFTQLLAFIVPFCLYLLITKKKPADVLSLKKVSFKNFLLIFVIIILFQPLMSFLSAITMLFFDNNVSDIMINLYSYPFLLVFVTLAVTPSICEEITMRGVIFSGYKDMPVIKGALMNGLFFGIMHLDAQQFLYAFFLGVIFYYLVYYTNSIFSSIFAHLVVNGTQSLFALFLLESQNQEIAEIPEIIQHIDEKIIMLVTSGILAFVTAPFAFALLYYFIFYNKKKNNQYVPTNETAKVRTKANDVFSISVVVIYVLYIAINIVIRFL